LGAKINRRKYYISRLNQQENTFSLRKFFPGKPPGTADPQRPGKNHREMAVTWENIAVIDNSKNK
jgi:hypothetical protein